MDFNIYEQDRSACILPRSRGRLGETPAGRPSGRAALLISPTAFASVVRPLHQLPIGPHQIRITIFTPG